MAMILVLSDRQKLVKLWNQYYLHVAPRVRYLNPKTPIHLMQGYASKVERVDIHIKHENMTQLRERRNKALAKGTLFGIENDYLDAKVVHQDRNIPAKIRLKGGEALFHLGTDKWSFRVKIRKNESLFGIRSFSLMSPRRRALLLEWFARKIAEKEGIISKRYQFINLFINGDNMGIYAMDEHTDKVMIEANGRREGPIVRLEQESAWLDGTRVGPESGMDEHYFGTEFDAIGLSDAGDKPLLQEQAIKALHLLEAFRRGDLKAHQVFDMATYAKWAAISDVIGAYNGSGMYNCRFYYNPVLSKFEPVPDDCYDEENIDPKHHLFRLDDPEIKGAFIRNIFSDQIFIEKYIRELDRVSQKAYLDGILNDIENELTENLHALYREYPYYEFPIGQLYQNQENIRRILRPAKGVIAHLSHSDADELVLDVGCTKSMPVIILKVTDSMQNEFVPIKKRRIIKGKEYHTPVHFESVHFQASSKNASPLLEQKTLTLYYRFLGMNEIRSQRVNMFAAYDRNMLQADPLRQAANYQEFPFISISESMREIVVKEGSWKLDRNLVIPQGYVLVVNPNTILDLVAGAKIISYSPIRFSGNEEHPVVITSSDRKGQGVMVLRSVERSFVKHAVFENLTSAAEGSWSLTGAVTFYESAVSFANCLFQKNKSEDALNIIRSDFELLDCLFLDIERDAIDTDFCNGTITACEFRNIGNDAIDLSGSLANVTQCNMKKLGDKGISVGESSKLRGAYINITNANIGLACKDLSDIDISQASIQDSKIGIAVFQKKSEYGPANVSVTALQLKNCAMNYLVESKSNLMIDDRAIDDGDKKANIAAQLYGR